MTGHQASPARAGLPAPPAATTHPHDPAGHPATGRPADLPPAAARKKTALYAPGLLGASAVGTMSDQMNTHVSGTRLSGVPAAASSRCAIGKATP